MPFVPFRVGRIPYGGNADSERIRRVFDFVNSLVDVNGDFELGDITVGRGGNRKTTNTAVGQYVLEVNDSGTNNTGVGQAVLKLNSSGGNNCAFGAGTLAANTTAGSNSAFGAGSMILVSTGGGNSAFGSASALFFTTGYQNVVAGTSAAQYQADGATPLQTPNTSVYIGYAVRGYNNSDANSIVIGANAIGEGANTTVIGNSSTTLTHIYGTVALSKVRQLTSAAADPTTTEYPTDQDWGIHKNTTSGNVFLAYNNGGSIVKVQLT